MSMDLVQASSSFTKRDLERMLLHEAAKPRALPFSLLEEITKRFDYKNEIGKGGFAVVYKGVLETGSVAVKRLSNTYMYENEFIREVECLMNVKHKNIVRFLGYCSDTQGNMQMYKGKFVMAEVQERLLCFEYVPNGSLDSYIEDASGDLDWETRYQIIKGICEGLHFLHSINILHLDLKPSNILMGDNLNPKITDFGLSRIFDESQTRVTPTKMIGTIGYLAPEFTSNVITHKYDLYSLGVIIMEILTGQKECQAIENILESWGKRLHRWEQKPLLEQLRICAEIGIACTNIDPAKRPVSVKNVIDRLGETEVIAGVSEVLPILDVHPLELRSSEINEPIVCSIHLTNKTDVHVAFTITEESSKCLRCSSELPLYGIVPPRSTYTLVVTTGHKMKLEEETNFKLTIESCTSEERYITKFMSQSECDDFFDESDGIGNTVHDVTLKANYRPEWDRASKYYHWLHPLQYRFYPGLSESTPCSLQLTNTIDEHVAFMLLDRSSDRHFPDTHNPVYGVVRPRSTCIVIGKAKEGMTISHDTDLVLQSILAGAKHPMLLRDEHDCFRRFGDARESGHPVVYEASLESIYHPQRGEEASEPAVRPTVIKHISPEGRYGLRSMDAHPTEPWIVIGHFDGNVTVWNHESETTLCSFKISKERVVCVKFDAAKKWIVCVTKHELIHVYDCACVTQIQKITSFRDPDTYSVGIHPTKPYVLSTSGKLWDRNKAWECTHIFPPAGCTTPITFNPEDPNSFAIVSGRHPVQVWSLDSSEPDCTLNGHLGGVLCLHFFKRGGGQFLITGSYDRTAKIWDLQKKVSIHTIEGFMSPVIHVVSIPGRPYLVTCSKSLTIHVWSSTDFSLKRSVNFSGVGKAYGLVCLMGSRRIAIGQRGGLSIMDIDDEEATANTGSNENSIVQLVN